MTFSYRGFSEATFLIFKTMNKKEFRVLTKHCFLMGKNTVEAKQWLDKPYGDSAPVKSTIIDWYFEFKRGRKNTDDAECSGCPKLKLIKNNLKLREIANTLKISEGTACLQFCTNLWGFESSFRSGCRVSSHPTKNNNASRIQSAVWTCSSKLKRIFCVDM